MHIVCLLSRNHALKKIIEKVKTASSKWIKTKGPRYRSFYWQAGRMASSLTSGLPGIEVEEFWRPYRAIDPLAPRTRGFAPG